MGRGRGDEQQKVFDFAFEPRRPRRGWFLVCMRRRRVYGTVLTVRPDGTFRRTAGHGLVIDSRKTGRTWESIQRERPGEYRFVAEIPPSWEAARPAAANPERGAVVG